jgi:quercetin dioxygenase-like cupin family protein
MPPARPVLRMALWLAVMGTLLFLPAGGLRWPGAWRGASPRRRHERRRRLVSRAAAYSDATYGQETGRADMQHTPTLPPMRRRDVAKSLTAMGLLALAASGPLPARAEGDAVRKVLERALPDLPGKVLTAVVVEYAPGGKSPPHRHDASVFAFVLSGSIRSGVEGGGEAAVYHAGQGWFEPPGTHHLVSENASSTEPASLLAVLVADAGARATVYDR